MTHASRASLAALMGIACIEAAHAADDEARALAAGCASCHQPAQRTLPALAGQSREELAAKLRGFRDGTRSGTIMPQLAKGYSPAQIDALAAYFAAQTP